MPRAATAEPETEQLIEAPVLEKPEMDLDAIFDLPQVQARMLKMAEAAAERSAAAAVAKVLAVMNPSKAPLTMIANVADRFITGSNNPEGGTSPHLKHYRCDRLKSEKWVEIDMDRYLTYMAGEKELPTNKNGHQVSAIDACVIRGNMIAWLNGHCYAYTENQVKQLEWMRTQPHSKGGAPDMYEDPGGEIYRCRLCPQLEPFGSQEGFNRHMQYVHSVANQAMPMVESLFANTSPDPFVAR